MSTVCPKCREQVLPAYNSCPYCGEKLTLPKLYSGKTAPMVIATQRMPAAGRTPSPYAHVRTAAAQPAGPPGRVYVTTGGDDRIAGHNVPGNALRMIPAPEAVIATGSGNPPSDRRA